MKQQVLERVRRVASAIASLSLPKVPLRQLAARPSRATMTEDPVIQAVREVRHRISESVGHDPHKLVAYYRQRQECRENRPVPPQSSGMELKRER